MTQIQYIKDLYENQDKSLNQIAKITGSNFRTVRKYAYMEDWNEKKLPNVNPLSYPTLGDFIPIIDEWLEQDKLIPRKQRHTMMRIFTRLRDEKGFKGSYSSVKKYVRKKRYLMNRSSDGFIPLAHPMAYAQVDFGEFEYYDACGVSRKAYVLIMTFPYSNIGFAVVMPGQNQECLLTGMRYIFDRIGGVPQVIRFDNLSAAVVKVLKNGERELTDGFTRFMLHYRFKAEFCNPASGNEKGNVENKVGYIRRNALVPKPTITSFDEFNQYLWDWCEKDSERKHYKNDKSIKELWEEEKQKLLVLPKIPYTVFRYETLTLNKYGFATIDTNKYGLNPSLNGCLVQAKIFYDQIEFYVDNKLAARYPRSYERNKNFMDWTKYIGLLCRKPRAAENARFFNQFPKLWKEHLTKTTGTDKRNALMLLKDIVSDGNVDVCDDTLSLAYENGRTDADSLRQFYYLIAKRENRPLPLEIEGNVQLHYTPDLSAYDALTGGEIDA